MGTRLPLLKPREVEANLRALGFVHVRTVGSHKQYERVADGKRQRAIVTVDVGKTQFSRDLMKNMIRQSNFTQEEFCTGVCKELVPNSNPVAEGSENA